MSAFFNLFSIILGGISWLIPLSAMRAHKKRQNIFYFLIVSFSACSLSLVLQLLEIRHRVSLEDWSALMDTMPLLVWAGAGLVSVTIGLNILAVNYHSKNGDE